MLAATLLASSCSGRSHENPAHFRHPDEPVVTGEPAGYNATDVTFADTLIAQDQQGIDVATLVPRGSTDSDFVGFAASSAAARRSEVTILKVMQVQWNSDQENPRGQPNAATVKGMIDPSTIANLRSLHGGAFETLWLRSMVGLDQASTDMADAEIANGKNVDAVGVAKQIVEGRQAEVDLMKKMAGA